MEFSKAKTLQNWGDYFLTRKDWRHENSYWCSMHRSKKSYKQVGNKKVRLYKGEISNGNNYRKVEDVQWNYS